MQLVSLVGSFICVLHVLINNWVLCMNLMAVHIELLDPADGVSEWVVKIMLISKSFLFLFFLFPFLVGNTQCHPSDEWFKPWTIMPRLFFACSELDILFRTLSSVPRLALTIKHWTHFIVKKIKRFWTQ